MRIKVVRFLFGDKATIGKLLVDDNPFCFTLEDKVRPPSESKVFGETAIPYGVFPVTLTYSPHFKRILPLLGGVPNYAGVRIHPGNTPADTEGCILVGMRYDQNTVYESRDTFNMLYDLIEHRSRQGESITIEVTK